MEEGLWNVKTLNHFEINLEPNDSLQNHFKSWHMLQSRTEESVYYKMYSSSDRKSAKMNITKGEAWNV